jgi:hypothetical protein
MSAVREIYAHLRSRGFLLLAGFTIVILALYIGELVESPDFSVPESKYEIRPDIPEIGIGVSVDFELIDKETGESIPADFEIVNPHNVPGDRGTFIGNTFTAPRWIPYEHFVTFTARARGEKEKTQHVVEIFMSGFPRASEQARPGGPYMPSKLIAFDPPVDSGLRLGQNTQIMTGDGWGSSLIVAHFFVLHQNEVVDYAGTISDEGIFTAPLELPDPPEVSINVQYYSESREPGHVSGIGKSITLVP